MRIYYVSRRSMLNAALLVVLLAGFIGFSLLYFNETGIATRVNEPIYQGNTGQKM